MKNSNEMVNSLLERRERYEAEQKRKRSIITRTVTSMCCLCLVALLGFGVWQNGLINSIPPAILDGENSSLQETDKTDETKSNNNEASSVIPDATVIWGNANDEVEDVGFVEWNDKLITSSLYNVLSDEKNNNILIAIGVGFDLDNKFVYNGKTIAEYAVEADNERLLYDKLGQLLKLGDSLKYGEDLYKTGTPTGERWAKEFYEETVENFGKDLLEKYIVNGEFFKEKLESDIANYDKYTPCNDEYKIACENYYQFVIQTAIDGLENQSVNYERRNGVELVIYATVKDFSSIEIDNVSFYSIAVKGDEGIDMSETSVDDVVFEP